MDRQWGTGRSRRPASNNSLTNTYRNKQPSEQQTEEWMALSHPMCSLVFVGVWVLPGALILARIDPVHLQTDKAAHHMAPVVWSQGACANGSVN